MNHSKNRFEYISIILIIVFCIIGTSVNFFVSRNINFDTSLTLLANQFLHGHISLEPTTSMPLGDISKYAGKFYVYFGPFSSMALIPFVLLFGSQFPQVFIGIATLCASFFVIYLFSLRLNFSKSDSIWLSIFYVFSTVLVSSSIINISAYQVEVLGSFLILLSLYEYISKRRPLVIGILIAFASLTRITLILSLIFFIVEFLQKRLRRNELLLLMSPVALGCIILGIYNYIRFGSILETGYLYNITLHSFPLSENLKYGYMSLVHLPTNLYSLLLLSPHPILMDSMGFVLKFPYFRVDPWGLSIWWTSPLFLALLYKFRYGIYSKSAMTSICFLAIPVLTYYSIGFSQFGYRYVLDFLPFIFVLLLQSLHSKLVAKEKILIFLGVLFNTLYMMSPWGLYPLFGIFK